MIKLEYDRGYANMNGPCEPIITQVRNILEENESYTFVGLIDEPSKYSNMEYATLVVEII